MYTLKVWNGKYGNNAKFIVKDSKGKFAEFSPARPNDVAWVDTDLTKEDEYKNWESFQDEKVNNLADVIM